MLFSKIAHFIIRFFLFLEIIYSFEKEYFLNSKVPVISEFLNNFSKLYHLLIFINSLFKIFNFGYFN